jgi:hypothetical protein
MPAGANMLYAWGSGATFFPFNTAPATKEEFVGTFIIYYNQQSIVKDAITSVDDYTKIDDNSFTITNGGDTTTFTRDATKDIEIWNAPPEVETTKQATIDVSTYDPANKPVITPTAGKQSMGSVEVTLDNIPSGATPVYDPTMDTYNQYGEYTMSQVGKYYCFITGGTTKELRQVQGDGVTTIQDLLDTAYGDGAGWNYCGGYGDYGFYFPYMG